MVETSNNKTKFVLKYFDVDGETSFGQVETIMKEE
jgi:hypothetical protein